MSIAFSLFSNNAATRNNAADTIAQGLNVPAWPAAMGGGKQTTNVVTRGGILVPAFAIPAAIGNQLADIAARWANLNEAERRVRIDAYLTNIAADAAMVAPPRMWLERNIGAAGIGGAPGGAAYPAGAQIGNGPLDYLWSNPNLLGNPTIVRNTTIEAKRDLGINGDRGQWQLAAQMATGRQVGHMNPRRLRGILTDGLQWRFYQLDCNTGTLDRTPALNAGIALQFNIIVRLTYKFLHRVNWGVDIWPAP